MSSKCFRKCCLVHCHNAFLMLFMHNSTASVSTVQILQQSFPVWTIHGSTETLLTTVFNNRGQHYVMHDCTYLTWLTWLMLPSGVININYNVTIRELTKEELFCQILFSLYVVHVLQWIFTNKYKTLMNITVSSIFSNSFRQNKDEMLHFAQTIWLSCPSVSES